MKRSPLALAFLLVAALIAPTLAARTGRAVFARAFSRETVACGGFSTEYERSSDCEELLSLRFPLKPAFSAVKTLINFAQLKTENNGVVHGKDGYLFTKFYSFDAQRLRAGIASIDRFAAESASPVFVMIVPTASYVLSDYLPAGLPFVNQKYFISQTERFLSVNTSAVNVKDILTVSDAQYLYYRTEPCWTSYAAWLGYSQFAALADFIPFEYSTAPHKNHRGFYGELHQKSPRPGAAADEIAVFDFTCEVTADGAPAAGLFDPETMSFACEKAGIARVHSPYAKQKNSSLLLIKDSFGECLAQFLANDYEFITAADPRYFNGSLLDLAYERFDAVLIVCGFESLAGGEFLLCNENQ